MKRKTIISVVISVIVFVLVGIVGTAALIYYYWPSNTRANSNLSRQSDMVETTCDWGRLADFPTSRKNFTIKTEGGSFTRSFRGSFSDSPQVIQKWLLDSPGVQNGSKEILPDSSTKYTLKMGGGATYGEVLISSDFNDVIFYVTWS